MTYRERDTSADMDDAMDRFAERHDSHEEPVEGCGDCADDMAESYWMTVGRPT